MNAEAKAKNLEICKQWAATEGVDKVIADHGVDVIVAPADSFFAGVGVGARKYTTTNITRHMNLPRC